MDAWIKGKADGAAEERKILIQKFEENHRVACKISSDIIDKIKENGIECKFAVIGTESISYFKSLIFIDSEVYTSLSKLKSVYKDVKKYSQPNISDTFYITHSILPLDKENINQKRILADGYFMSYGKL
jgi:hypothetical protein